MYQHRACLSRRTESVKLLVGCNFEHNMPDLFAKIIEETGAKPICQPIYRTIYLPVLRHKLMVEIVMVRNIAVHELLLECLPFKQNRG